MKRLLYISTLLFAAFILSGSRAYSQTPCWNLVGLAGLTAGGASFTDIAVNSAGVPYVVYQDTAQSGKATVRKYDLATNTWINVGTAGFTSGIARYCRIAMYNDTPVVAFTVPQGSNTVCMVYKFNGASWVGVGTGGGPTGGVASTGGAAFVGLAIDNTGKIYVSYEDAATTNKVSVRSASLSGTPWSTVGTLGFSDSAVFYTSIAVDPSNTPYVVYQDLKASVGGKGTCQKFSGTAWSLVGPLGFTPSFGRYFSLKINSSGTPYVAFQDGNATDHASVMKYSAGSWSYVGSSGLSPNAVTYTSLALTSTDLPYVAYVDQATTTHKISVSNFNGTAWAQTGAAGFSAGNVDYTSMAMGVGDVPYVVYQDQSSLNRATVQKFTQMFVTLSRTDTALCNSDTAAYLPYTLGAGSPTVYSVNWGSAATAAGFVNISNRTIVNPIKIITPLGAPGGTYSATVSFSNGYCVTVDTPITITVHASPTITLGSGPTVTQGTTTGNLPYSAPTGSPVNYSIYWSAAAIAQGFTNVSLIGFPSSPVVLTIPATCAPGSYTATLTVFNGTCTSVPYSFTVTVLPPDHNPVFTGGTSQTLTVCQSSGTHSINSILTISDSDTGQVEVWSVATAPANGSLGGFPYSSISTGTSITPIGLTYTPSSGFTGSDSFTVQISDGYSTAITTVHVTVLPIPLTAPISGSSTVCIGIPSTMSDAYSGGVWSSTATGVATIDATTGVVTGVATGSDTIKYTNSNACGTSQVYKLITVANGYSAGTISGSSSACVGSNVTLSETSSGGTWTSSNNSIATVSASGVVTGVATGVDTIYYTVSGACGSLATSFSMTISSASSIGAITGTAAVCTGFYTTLTDTTTGGTWSSFSTSVATINSAGVVTGLTAGTTIISYTVINGCGTYVVTLPVVVTLTTPSGVISGSSTVCVGANASLSESTTGGVWSSSNTSFATVSSSGVVTGVAAGSVTISYSVTSACGTVSSLFPMTVNPLPNAGTITGLTSVCQGSNLTLSDAITGGTWSASPSSVATVSAGIVFGVSAGTAVVTYTVSNSCGVATSTFNVTVNPLPNAGTINGVSTICFGVPGTMTDTTSGGTWTSSNPSIATVSSSGVVTGVTLGNITVSYTVSGVCGSATATHAVTIATSPSGGSITGPSTVCTGSLITLTDTMSGGTWSSSNPAVATVSAVGFVTGVGSGVATITYTVSNPCGTASAIRNITVNSVPSAGTIIGSGTVCVSASTTLSDAVSGGTWTSSNTAVALVNSTGMVTGVSTGTVNITYTVTTACGTAATSTPITVNAFPTAGTITGAVSLCAASTTTMTEGVTGGTWSSSNSAVASIDASGVVTGVAAGSATLSYVVTNSCGTATTTKPITVNALPNPGTITGTTTVCAGSVTTLSDVISGGSWSSTAPGIANVSATGVVGGVTAGTAIISYTVSSAFCGSGAATATVTVNPLPNAGAISGSNNVCVASAITLSESASGGTWSASNGNGALLGAGIIGGVTLGLDTIHYTVTNGCGTAVTSYVVTINAASTAGTISGATSACTGASISLTDAVTGGTWSSSNSTIASVNASGVVTGVAVGSATITYLVTSSCGSSIATSTITVNPSASAGSISGSTDVCVGNNISLFDAATGGTWSSSSAATATVSATGMVTGVAAGTATISYSVTNSCGTSSAITNITVSPAPNAGAITGSGALCTGSSSTLTESASGGVWSSSNNTIFTVSSTGVITGVAAGSATVSYTATTGCGSASASLPVTVTVVPTVAAITGPTTICTGSSITLSDVTPGGTWSSSNPFVANIGATGVVNGVNSGTATISYTWTNSCGSATATYNLTISPSADAGIISGSSTMCAGTVSTLSETVSGGTWTSSNTSLATVSATGVVSALVAGSVTITYNISSTCGTANTTFPITINPIPDAGTLSGTSGVCTGTNITLTDAATGGIWSSSNTSVATVTGTGVVTGISNGSATITYSVTNSCGTANVTTSLTVGLTPTVGAISGASSLCEGSTTTLTESTSGGTWSSSNNAIATVSGTGLVTAVSPGTTTIAYVISGSCGTATATTSITVNPGSSVAAIIGSPTICVGYTVTFSDATAGGVWSSTDPSVASVNAVGVVSSLSTGTTTISYQVTGGCGSSTATYTVTTGLTPTAGAISGPTVACQGSTATLSESASGGVWSSSDATIASVSAAGVVTGVAVGAATITYTVTTACGTALATYGMIVNPSSSAGTISGPTTVCAGSTISLADPLSGGVWSSSNTTVATVDASGVVTGVANGAASIIYSITTSCGVATSSYSIGVGTVASAGTISGTLSVCGGGASTTLSETASGGVWSSSNPAIATVSTTGVVTGVGGGPVTISYTETAACGSVSATATVTVSPFPNAGIITGVPFVCPGLTTSLTDTATGGVWSSGNPAIASVSATGVVTGVALGAVNIYYTVVNSCGTSNATISVTVTNTPSAGTITGVTSFCQGVTSTLSDAVPGGTWSSSNTAVATVNPIDGAVVGVGGGSSNITYSFVGSCGTFMTTTTVTVSPLPTVGTITGVGSICSGTSSTFTESVSGGTWSSTTPSVATVSATGVVTALTNGTTVISYSQTNGCGTVAATQSVTVNTGTGPSAITGTTTLCVGGTTSLSDAVSGGTWSSSNSSVASVSAAGTVTGVGAGTATITYTVPGSCGTGFVTAAITVNSGSAGSITGATSICLGTNTTLVASGSGGVWSSSNAAVATVTATGVVTGVTTGSVIISYSTVSTCGTSVATAFMSVNPMSTAGSVNGVATLCPGTSSTFTDPVSGGTWSSSNTAVATVNTFGVVSAVSVGFSTISYTVTGTCGTVSATAIVLVTGAPTSAGTISGSSTLCPGNSTSFTDGVSGGTWSSSNTTVATVTTMGVVHAVAAGSATITYTVANACGSMMTTSNVTVNPAADAGTISAPSTTFCAGSTTTLSDAVSGGTWTSSNPSAATVDAAGVVTGVSFGSSVISYSTTNSCGTATATVTVNINPTPAPGAIGGPAVVCHGSTYTLTNSLFGGTWSSSDATIASIGAASGVMVANSVGIATITYSVSNAFGCTAFVTSIDTVNQNPFAGSISASSTVACAGATLTLTDAASGGTWSSSNPTIATVDATGVVTGVSMGSSVISYTSSNVCGTVSATVTVNILAAPVLSAISGPATLCVGNPATLTDATFTGTWTSSNTSVATIGASSGVISPIATGTTTVSYSLTNAFGCSTMVTTTETVNAGAVAGSIVSGTTTVCQDNSLTLTETSGGGVWSSSDPTVAPVGATGVVYGLAAGTTNITYTVTTGAGCTALTSASITVNPLTTPAVIAGPSTLCVGATGTLTDATFGGVWTSGTPAVVTIGTFGDMTAVSAGTSTMSYSYTNIYGCTATVVYTETIGAMPVVSAIAGAGSLCTGASATLTDATAGGTWASSDVTVVTIGASTGVTTGVAAGTATISYTVTSALGCATTVTATETVNSLPSVLGITGSSSVCAGATTTLADATAGGTWSSSAAATATVDASGVVTGVAAGTATITYTVTNAAGCSNATTASITVNAAPSVAAITGATDVCVGATALLSDVTTAGSWTSSNTAAATISATGLMTGVSAGVTTISYTVTNAASCSTTVTMSDTVSTVPVVAAITGSTSVCAGSAIALGETTSGGTWTSSATGVATVGVSGIVTGVASGTSTIAYTVNNGSGCSASASVTVTVNPVPLVSAITGGTSICAGTTSTLADATLGGSWAATPSSIVTVSASGVATGVAAGSGTVSYTVTSSASCATTVTAAITVATGATVSAITGSSSVCNGLTTALSETTPGGSWSSSNPAIASVDASGVVTGMAAGTATISYTVTVGSCVASATFADTVNPTPSVNAISGSSTLCAGSSTTFTDATASGTWTSSNPAIANIGSTTGVVTTIAIGSVTISYSVTNTFGCVGMATLAVGVDTGSLTGNMLPVSGSATLCHGLPANLSVTSPTSGLTYQWYDNGNPVSGATNNSYAADTIGMYTVRISTGTCSAMISGVMVQAQPNPIIHLGAGNLLYTGAYATYQWFLNGTAIAGATSSLYTESANGTYTVAVTDANGCSVLSDGFLITGVNAVVNVSQADIKLFPNPATSVIRIEAPVKVTATLHSVDGKLISTEADASSIDVSNLASGMYLIMIYSEDHMLLKTDKFIKE